MHFRSRIRGSTPGCSCAPTTLSAGLTFSGLQTQHQPWQATLLTVVSSNDDLHNCTDNSVPPALHAPLNSHLLASIIRICRASRGFNIERTRTDHGEHRALRSDKIDGSCHWADRVLPYAEPSCRSGFEHARRPHESSDTLTRSWRGANLSRLVQLENTHE